VPSSENLHSAGGAELLALLPVEACAGVNAGCNTRDLSGLCVLPR
jgi:hypothetical protein